MLYARTRWVRKLRGSGPGGGGAPAPEMSLAIFTNKIGEFLRVVFEMDVLAF